MVNFSHDILSQHYVFIIKSFLDLVTRSNLTPCISEVIGKSK